jgi:hypothetical protein
LCGFVDAVVAAAAAAMVEDAVLADVDGGGDMGWTGYHNDIIKDQKPIFHTS